MLGCPHMNKQPLACVLSLLLLIPGGVQAQNADKDDPGKELPPVETLSLETNDNVFLAAKYYPGTKGKEAVPVIMLHGMINPAANGAVYYKLAQDIQKYMGHAVIVPDLRGHGKSINRRNPADINGRLPIDRDTFGKEEFKKVLMDIEACKKFLMNKNNQGELNIEKLCVIASDVSAIVATNWAAWDWNLPAKGFIRPGQNVKALILLTPLQSYKGLTVQRALNHEVIKRQLSIMIVAGQQEPKYYSDSKRIYNQLHKFHPDKFENEKDERENKKLWEYGLATSKQGSSLLTVPNLKPSLSALIGNFIKMRLENQEGFAWQNRDPNAE